MFLCAACRRVCGCAYVCLLAVVWLCVWSMICAVLINVVCFFRCWSLLAAVSVCLCSFLFVFVCYLFVAD